MHPILLKIGSLPLYSYGGLLALAFFVGLILAMKRAPKMGVKPELISDLALYILLGIVVGARLLHVLTQWTYYSKNFLEIFKIWEGGLAFHGGLIGAVLASLIYLRYRKESPWRVGDVIIPSVALGHAIGRVGCFLNGCCFGPCTDLPWGVSFPPGSLASQEQFSRGLLSSPQCSSLPVHPTQLYSALFLLVIFVLLLALTRQATFPGEVFWAYGVMYGGARFVLELLRDDNPLWWGDLSLYQCISLILIVISLVMLALLRHRFRCQEIPLRHIYSG